MFVCMYVCIYLIRFQTGGWISMKLCTKILSYPGVVISLEALRSDLREAMRLPFKFFNGLHSLLGAFHRKLY